MTSVSHVQPVTLIREQFAPSPYVQRALGKFFEGEAPEFRLYSTAQRLVDQADYHQSRYDHELKLIQQKLRFMGRQALSLTGLTHLADRPDGGVRLFMEPSEPERLAQMATLLDEISGSEVAQSLRPALYVDFARDTLVKNVQQRVEAVGNFQARARHPALRNVFTVSNPTIVAQDLLMRHPDVTDG